MYLRPDRVVKRKHHAKLLTNARFREHVSSILIGDVAQHACPVHGLEAFDRDCKCLLEFKDYDTLVPYGQTGRVLLTTLTREFFVPRFAERDEGEREKPYEKYPWDGVSGVRPFHEIAAQTTVGVY